MISIIIGEPLIVDEKIRFRIKMIFWYVSLLGVFWGLSSLDGHVPWFSLLPKPRPDIQDKYLQFNTYKYWAESLMVINARHNEAMAVLAPSLYILLDPPWDTWWVKICRRVSCLGSVVIGFLLLESINLGNVSPTHAYIYDYAKVSSLSDMGLVLLGVGLVRVLNVNMWL